MKHIVRSDAEDPLRQATLRYGSAYPLEPVLRRSGRPKTSWAHAVYERLWKKSHLGPAEQYTNKRSRNEAIEKMRGPIESKTL